VTNPTARLLRATRLRLVGVTFGLLAVLVVGIGAATAVAGLGALDAAVDRALESTVEAAVSNLDGELPHESSEGDEIAPASSDTFVLYLDVSEHVVASPSRVGLAGLPNRDALAAVAGGAARDLRTVDAGGVSVRLLSVPVHGDQDTIIGYVQGGFVLTLHDEQSRSLVVTIVVVGLAGLVAAGIVTLLVTSRALVPIRRSFDAQRRFVADASHELRTPVALIRANAEVLQREGLLEGRGAPLAEDIVAESDRMGRLVGDLLTLASADSHDLPLELTLLDLAEIVRETARNVGAHAAARGISIAVDVDGAGPVPVLADRDRLVQLVLILVDNAIAHSPDRGTIRIDVSTEGPRATLVVRDQGPGVPAIDRERIFEPFTRLSAGRGSKKRGSGLGLAIGSRIAGAHRGSISVDDAPGGGARFTVSLPMSHDSR
jgi:signal transduction histidine kinase